MNYEDLQNNIDLLGVVVNYNNINININPDNLLNVFMNYLYEDLNDNNNIEHLNNLIYNNINILNNNNIRQYILDAIENRNNVNINNRNNLINHINNIYNNNIYNVIQT